MRLPIILILFLTHQFLIAQNTIGLQILDPDKTAEGYNLIFPHNQSDVFLLDNCGQVVHKWEGDDMYRPGNSVYLLENGNLIKCKRNEVPIDDPIWAGGGGAVVEIRDWDNQLLWSFEQNNDSLRLHHDVAPMPNGNILMLSWELRTNEEALAAGRDPNKLSQNKLWPDYVFEVDPTTDEVVWEWHAWDHLIQDFDASKANFGVVADHPELIDINFDTHDGHPDWMHANAMDYNPVLDQILISVPYFHEVWVIDHSTTTAEAATHVGGRSGKGGDLLYRWGNPIAYRQGSAADQLLFFPHDIHWIDPMAQAEDPDFGKLAVYNNRVGTNYSTGNTWTPSYDAINGQYLLTNNQFGPADFDWTIKHPVDSTLLYSNSLSSAQILPNGNALLLAGRFGHAFEISPQNELVWEYIIPIRAGEPVAQGTSLNINNNITFRMKRYPLDYAAFQGRDLSPQAYLELQPNESFCRTILPVDPTQQFSLEVFPNPATDRIQIRTNMLGEKHIRLFDAFGNLLREATFSNDVWTLPAKNLASGMYMLQGKRYLFEENIGLQVSPTSKSDPIRFSPTWKSELQIYSDLEVRETNRSDWEL